MRNISRLCLEHFWVAFAAFAAAAVLGTWQMWVRSPLGVNTGTPGEYYMSVTAHGVAMAYVLTTFFIMGFGYFVAVDRRRFLAPERTKLGMQRRRPTWLEFLIARPDDWLKNTFMRAAGKS